MFFFKKKNKSERKTKRKRRGRKKGMSNNDIQEYCPYCTRLECPDGVRCQKIHFTRVFRPWTDPGLGDCPFLDTCHHPGCKYVHYEKEENEEEGNEKEEEEIKALATHPSAGHGGEWLRCDLRRLDLEVLGKFSVILADPPWAINMRLAYGTLTDTVLRALDLGRLSDDGLLFLWVTGRAADAGRECLAAWGYRLVEEIVWVKIDQLQRVAAAGHTGHWFNHSKEHCLVGAKGALRGLQRFSDCNVIVAQPRESSRKPDELYGIIERAVPEGRKLELFGRAHNLRAGWVTLGDQLPPSTIQEGGVIDANIKRTYGGSLSAVPGVL